MKELYVNNTEARTEEALAIVDKYINDEGLEGKQAIHLRLAVEETLGMFGAMTGEYDALLKLDKDDR